MTPERQRPRLKVEDLLRLKRAERPSSDFWKSFETELHQKQLAALLEKRPWWHGLSYLLTRSVTLPAGLAAVVALSFVAVRHYAPPVAANANSGDNFAVANGAPVNPASRADVVESVATAQLPVTVVKAPEVSESMNAASSTASTVAATIPGDIAEKLPWSAPRVDDTPSARSIAANLARLEQTDPELLESVMSGHLRQSARTPVEPAPLTVELAAVSTEKSSRRTSRLLANYDDRHYVPDPSLPDLVRERAARRLADPELFDQIRRLDLKGNSVSLKL